MDRLTAYIARQFTAQALTIFLAGGVLIWLMQLLRLFDIVSAQGQNIFTLMGQSALTTPTYARSILYVCLAIGLVRGLRSLQQSRELHTIHAARRTDALWKAIAIFTLAGMLAVAAIAHWIEPRSRALSSEWSAQIAADVVGRALTPGRFSEVTSGLVATARGRNPDGSLAGFFLDDSSSPTRRTYFAETARVLEDENGYQLILNNGAIQYEDEEREALSQIAFAQYHISVESLIDAASPQGGIEQLDTPALLAALEEGTLSARQQQPAWDLFHSRMADILRALTFSVLAASIMAFPHGRRSGRGVPMELTILIVAFGEQALTAFIGTGAYNYVAPSLLLVASILLLWRRLARAGVGVGTRRRRPA